MKIRNATHWRTDHIRAFLARIAERELDPEKRKRVRIEVQYTRRYGGGSSGCAWGDHAVVRLPRNQPDKVDFAHTIAHEYAHLRGMNHKDGMGTSPRYGRTGNWREIYAWAESLPLEVNPAKVDHRCAKRVPRKTAWGLGACGARARYLVGSFYLCKRHVPAGVTTATALPERERAPRVTADDRRAGIERQIARWTTKRKRAETILKKWTRRLRDLDRRTQKAASALPPEHPGCRSVLVTERS